MIIDVPGLMSELIGTLVGAALGFAFALWWDRRRGHEEEAARLKRIIASLEGEISGMGLEVAEPGIEAEDDETDAISASLELPWLPSAAFETAVSSGDLGLLPAEVQNQLASFYDQLSVARKHRDNAAVSYATSHEDVGAEVTFLQNAFEHLRAHCQMLAEERPTILSALENIADRK